MVNRVQMLARAAADLTQDSNIPSFQYSILGPFHRSTGRPRRAGVEEQLCKTKPIRAGLDEC